MARAPRDVAPIICGGKRHVANAFISEQRWDRKPRKVFGVVRCFPVGPIEPVGISAFMQPVCRNKMNRQLFDFRLKKPDHRWGDTWKAGTCMVAESVRIGIFERSPGVCGDDVGIDVKNVGDAVADCGLKTRKNPVGCYIG